MSRRARVLTALALALSGAVLLLVGTPTSLGAYSAVVSNTGNTAVSGVWKTATTCLAEARSDAAYFYYRMDDARGSTAADSTGNNLGGTYRVPSGITFRGSTGPCSDNGTRVATFDGQSGYLTGTQIAGAIPTALSLEIWFKTTTTQGGKLIGVGNQATGASGQYDRHLFMSNNGRLSFGTYDGGAHVLTSAASYNDGEWHHAVATLSPSGSTQGMRLYVDGSLVGSNTSWTKGEPVSNAYVRIAYDNLGGWSAQGDSGPPTSYYFKGSLANAAGYGSALSPARVRAHYDAAG